MNENGALYFRPFSNLPRNPSPITFGFLRFDCYRLLYSHYPHKASIYYHVVNDLSSLPTLFITSLRRHLSSFLKKCAASVCTVSPSFFPLVSCFSLRLTQFAPRNSCSPLNTKEKSCDEITGGATAALSIITLPKELSSLTTFPSRTPFQPLKVPSTPSDLSALSLLGMVVQIFVGPFEIFLYLSYVEGAMYRFSIFDVI